MLNMDNMLRQGQRQLSNTIASKLPNNIFNTPITQLQQELDIMSFIKLALMSAIKIQNQPTKDALSGEKTTEPGA